MEFPENEYVTRKYFSKLSYFPQDKQGLIDPFKCNMASFCGIMYSKCAQKFILLSNHALYMINQLIYDIDSCVRLNCLFGLLMNLGLFSRWDIIAERLGFMLVFGDLVWIPFTFSIQACGLYFLNRATKKKEIENVTAQDNVVLSFTLPTHYSSYDCF